jgi:hypothetical protein
MNYDKFRLTLQILTVGIGLHVADIDMETSDWLLLSCWEIESQINKKKTNGEGTKLRIR